MQSLNTNESCKTQNTFNNEVFNPVKISFSTTEETSQIISHIDYFERSHESKDYAPVHDQFSKGECLPNETAQKLSNNSNESHKCWNDSYANNAHSNKTCSNIKDAQKVPKSPPADGSQRTIKCTFFRTKRVGDIVSTSRTGHLIERKGGSCFVLQEKINSDETEGCDSNDNTINDPKSSNSEMHDVNDNPSDETCYQKEEEASLSENEISGHSECETPCGIGLLERLIRSHPVWFLPGIQRAGAVHLLQGKEEGNFIVRQSSQADTMAVSVRLPVGKGPYIEHYLIQAVDGQLSLESSENLFESIPSLIAHYCQCCDELPVQLTLPRTIREAKNRQQLSSLALLGPEFWRYPMANPRPPESRNSSPNSIQSDSLSSFDGIKKVVNQNNEIILDLVPIHRDSQPSSLSTFKSPPTETVVSSLVEETKPKRPHTLDLISTNSEKTGIIGNKTPPQPPPRWTKPSKNIFSSFTSSSTMIVSTATTTAQPIHAERLGRGGSNECPPYLSRTYPTMTSTSYDRNVSSPQSDQTNLRSFAFERDMSCRKPFKEERGPQLISPVSDTTGFVSKNIEKVHVSHSQASTPTEKVEHIFKKYKKEGKFKESTHYQESDILESPTLCYYKSNVADKQSDYEDIWATDSLTTFKPINTSTVESEARKIEPEMKKPPDLLERLEKTFKPDRREDKSPDFPRDFQNSEIDPDGAQSSPFYAEPADALVVRRKTKSSSKSRHSDPFSFNNWSVNTSPYFSGGNVLNRIDSQNEMYEDSSWKGKPSLSFDNIISLKKKEAEGKSKAALKGKNIAKAKPVRPPKVDSNSTEKNRQYWAVDSSWEFIGNEENEKEGERRFPSIEQQMDAEETPCKYTVQEMISQRFPQFKISGSFNSSSNTNGMSKENVFFPRQTPQQKSDSNKSGSRISAYDNLTCDRPNFLKPGNPDSERSNEGNCDISTNTGDDRGESRVKVFSDTLRFKKRVECGSVTEDNDDAQTIFSEPWDSSRWEYLLPINTPNMVEPGLENNALTDDSLHLDNGSLEPLKASSKMILHPRRTKEDREFGVPLTFGKGKLPTTGATIRSYALQLASDKSTTFAQNIENFIECTLESKEINPQVVMRNMRQFMSGMKNYLVKHGEREFEKQVEKERMKLKSTEFLNLDAILEGVMHKLVVRPLREHLYKLFVDEYMKNGAIQLLYENLNYARTKSLHDLGLKTKIAPPDREALDVICKFITKLQEVDSPLEKLDHLLACVSTIIHSVKSSNQGKGNIVLGADDILPLFVWVLVQSGFIAAEIEAEYMWGLLHPSLLSGEGCYYLTTLSSAVHVLKNLKSCDLDQSNRLATNEWHCGDQKFVLKIIVPDELHGSILTKTLPVKPNMTTKDVCKIIAHKIRITNPQDYGLFRLVDGDETLLNDNECPQEVKSQFLESGKHCTLAYKRIDAKIGWPRTP